MASGPAPGDHRTPTPEAPLRPLIAVLALAALAAACTPGADESRTDRATATTPAAETTEAPAAPPSPADGPDDSSSQAAPAPGDESPDGPTPTPTPADEECTDDDLGAMSAAVRGQLDAFGADDWAAALDFTSTAFRAGVDVAGLERIIEDGFPVVADATGATVLGCSRGVSTVATLLVRVQASDGASQALIYLFELEPDGWRIGGAVPAGDDEGPGITA